MFWISKTIFFLSIFLSCLGYYRKKMDKTKTSNKFFRSLEGPKKGAESTPAHNQVLSQNLFKRKSIFEWPQRLHDSFLAREVV